MTTLEAIVLGIVEGFTEFLPVSSTAHLVAASEILGIPESIFLSSFIIAIQLGAIASVVLMYWKTILWDFETTKRVIVAFIPTALIGFLLYQLVKGFLFENLQIIAWALILGGVVLILFEHGHREPEEAADSPELSYRQAFLIGLAQTLAIVPGVSRSGATILAGLSLGLTRKKIVDFSFLIAIPTMLSATAYDLYKSASNFAQSEWSLLLLGFLTAFAAAYVGIVFLVRYIATHTFSAFGIYRIIVGVLILFFLA